MIKIPKLNEQLKRVQIGKDREVYIETDRSLWFLWVYKDGNWDADTITHSDDVYKAISDKAVTNVFCIWHGQHRTNLFLMNKSDLIKRLKKL